MISKNFTKENTGLIAKRKIYKSIYTKTGIKDRNQCRTFLSSRHRDLERNQASSPGRQPRQLAEQKEGARGRAARKLRTWKISKLAREAESAQQVEVAGETEDPQPAKAAAQLKGSTAIQPHSNLDEQKLGTEEDRFWKLEAPKKGAAEINFWIQLQKNQTQQLQPKNLETSPGYLLQEQEKEKPRNQGLERLHDRPMQERGSFVTKVTILKSSLHLPLIFHQNFIKDTLADEILKL